MIITFCGHSKLYNPNTIKDRLARELRSLLEQGSHKFYLGGYGDFDLLAAQVLHELKPEYPGAESILILPYLDRQVDASLYDGTIYPPLENVPKRFAISCRNKWMVDQADLVIACVDHDWGGAVTTLEMAQKKKLPIINTDNIHGMVAEFGEHACHPGELPCHIFNRVEDNKTVPEKHRFRYKRSESGIQHSSTGCDLCAGV